MATRNPGDNLPNIEDRFTVLSVIHVSETPTFVVGQFSPDGMLVQPVRPGVDYFDSQSWVYAHRLPAIPIDGVGDHALQSVMVNLTEDFSSQSRGLKVKQKTEELALAPTDVRQAIRFLASAFILACAQGLLDDWQYVELTPQPGELKPATTKRRKATVSAK